MRAAKTDANQQIIIDGLRACGCSVQPTHMVGRGFPDLIAGYRGRNQLLEVKLPGGKLNERQLRWHADWRGSVVVVRNLAEALEAMGIEQKAP